MEVSVIVPAYNEETRIARVLDPLTESPFVSEIIVVDDGSRDNLSKIVDNYHRVNLIRLPNNIGKAGAVREGLGHCRGRLILLLDADLVGLTPRHIRNLLSPLYRKDIEMTIGVFQSGRLITDLAQRIAPNLTGQRAFRRTLVDDIKGLDMKGFNMEMAISDYMKRNKIKYEIVNLDNITHIMKEEKWGLRQGLSHRIMMYKDILKYWIN